MAASRKEDHRNGNVIFFVLELVFFVEELLLPF